ncbi:TPA: hypothetical protein UL921_002395 [Stenotrophomonas maltophilia]|nr:hypothetical protein [Stenotrophomonas maltophilia]
MNTTMADGAEQRLDAQIAEALFGQPGMSKMDVANRVRELRGDGPALLVGGRTGGSARLGDSLPPLPCTHYNACGDGSEPLYTSEQMRDYALSAQPCPPSSFDLESMLAACVPGGDIADPQVIADNIRRWFAAQPSPAVQAELVQEALEYFEQSGDAGDRKYVEAIRNALAARQPVGQEPVAYLHRDQKITPEQWSALIEGMSPLGTGRVANWLAHGMYCIRKPDGVRLERDDYGKRGVCLFITMSGEQTEISLAASPQCLIWHRWRNHTDEIRMGEICPKGDGWQAFYPSNPPARAVDLEQFRQPVQDWLDDAQASMEEHGDYDGVFGYAIEEGTRLLALIDGHSTGGPL